MQHRDRACSGPGARCVGLPCTSPSRKEVELLEAWETGDSVSMCRTSKNACSTRLPTTSVASSTSLDLHSVILY
ncbi:unnamed protein product [Urochloa humidicola]